MVIILGQVRDFLVRIKDIVQFQYEQRIAKVDHSGNQALHFLKRWGYLVALVLVLLVMTIMNFNALSSNPTVSAPDFYAVRCLKCGAIGSIDRREYERGVPKNANAHGVAGADALGESCASCNVPYSVYALVPCPTCHVRFVMGKDDLTQYPQTTNQRAALCPKHTQPQTDVAASE